MANKGQKKVHRCPAIPDGFTRKMTGPAWAGQSEAKSRRMWYDWLRDLEQHATKMPRKTH